MASLLLSLSLLFAAESPAAVCPYPEVIAGGPTLTKVGDWGALAKVFDRDADISTEATAIQSFCGRYECNATTLGFCDNSDRPTCYVRAPGGPWHSFEPDIESYMGQVSASAELTNDPRYLRMNVFAESMQRIGDTPCFFEGDDQPGCGFSMEDYGTERGDYVFEVATMTMVFAARTGFIDTHSRYSEACGSDERVVVVSEGAQTVFERTTCDGKPERFALPDIAACTAAGRDVARDRRSDAIIARRAAADIARGRELTR